MQIATFRRNLFLFLLLSILSTPWAWAAGGLEAERPAEAASSPLDLLGRLWMFLIGAGSEEGCMIDPSGRCTPAPQPQTDEGCHIDPSGGCRF